MKKLGLLFCAVFIVLASCACGKESKLEGIRRENHYGIGWTPYNSEGIKCEEIKDAVSFYRSDYFLTNDEMLYKLNVEKLFSNDKNCVQMDYDVKGAKYFYKNGLFDENDELLYVLDIDYDGLTVGESVITKDQYKYLSVFDDLEDEDYDFVSTENYNFTTIFVKDREVYWYKEDKTGETSTKKEKVVLLEVPDDETILGLHGAVLKTDKNYYTLQQINEEECEKYADVKCEVKMARSSLSDVYDDVLVLTEKMLIEKDYKVYGKGVSFPLSSD